MTDLTISNDIMQWLATHFGSDRRADWYVGIANNVEDRLFGDHNVDRINGFWIHRKAFNADHARSAEKILLNNGYDGGSSGGDHTTVFVYAFRKITGTTR